MFSFITRTSASAVTRRRPRTLMRSTEAAVQSMYHSCGLLLPTSMGTVRSFHTTAKSLCTSSEESIPPASQEEIDYWDDVLFDVSDRSHQSLRVAQRESLKAAKQSNLLIREKENDRSATPSAGSEPPFLVYNVFTNRQSKSDSSSVRSLAHIGFVPDRETRLMKLAFPERLLDYAKKIQSREASPPVSWTSSVHKQLTVKLMHASWLADKNNDDLYHKADAHRGHPLVNEVTTFIDALHNVMRARMVSSRGTVSGTVGSLTEADTSALMSTNAVEPIAETATSVVITEDQLTDEQARIVDLACQGYNLYIGGGAGTGKTTLLRALRQKLHSELRLSVATTALTGIAAVNIQGTTLHHRFGITRNMQFLKNKELTKYDVLIIDEVSMVPASLFYALDAALQKANGVTLPFGGVQVILCGDFMQLSTISDMPIVGAPLFRQHFVMVRLREVKRQTAYSLFARQLDEIRQGISPHDLSDTITMLPSSCGFVENAINLLPTNAEVAEANRHQLAKLPGEEVVLTPLVLPPSLRGRWSACYIVTVPSDVSKFDPRALMACIEHHLFKAPGMVSLSLLTNTLGAGSFVAPDRGSSPCAPSTRAISLYPIFDDAYALRLQFPPSLDEVEIGVLQRQLDTLNDALATCNNGVHKVVETLPTAAGLQTPEDEKILAHYAKMSSMGAPLSLKLGCRVLVRANLSSSIVNGSVGTVVGFRACSPESVSHYLLHSNRDVLLSSYANFQKYEIGNPQPVLPVVDFGDGVVETIPPCSFEVGGMADTNHYSASVVTVPLTLAYAFTVHKVQGLTLIGRVHLDLTKMWPCDHLLYVAMSRVKNPDQLSVSGYSSELVKVAAECLLFDNSVPSVDEHAIPPLALPATWKQFPGRRRFSVAEKQQRRIARHNATVQRRLAAKTTP